jgi:hypothetical protein
LTHARRVRAAWLAAFGASALASAAEPSAPPEQPQPHRDADAELLEFLGSEDGSEDMWTQFLVWLETTAEAKREPPAPKADGASDE